MGATKEMSMNLYQITEEQRAIMYAIELAEGELTPELEEKLTITALHLESKASGYLEYIGSKESLNSRIDTEIKRLQAMKKTNVNIINRLKDNLLNAVKLFGDFEVGFRKFSTRKSERIDVEDVNELPEEFRVIKVSTTADKISLKKAIKSGVEIEGVSLIEIQNLKIS